MSVESHAVDCDFCRAGFGPGLASADEPAAHLKQAPGVDVVEGHCGACHSLDYIEMNSPFLDAAKWDGVKWF